MVRLELFQSGEGAIPLLCELQSLSALGCELLELVEVGIRVTQERQCHQHNAHDGQRGAQQECSAQRPRTGLPASS